MIKITSHVLDTRLGRPAQGVTIGLFYDNKTPVTAVASSDTNGDGRWSADFVPPGRYRLRFEIGPYFEKEGSKSFYPFVDVVVDCAEGERYHIPLLINGFGYTTYRGS